MGRKEQPRTAATAPKTDRSWLSVQDEVAARAHAAPGAFIGHNPLNAYRPIGLSLPSGICWCAVYGSGKALRSRGNLVSVHCNPADHGGKRPRLAASGLGRLA